MLKIYILIPEIILFKKNNLFYIQKFNISFLAEYNPFQNFMATFLTAKRNKFILFCNIITKLKLNYK